MSEMYLSDYGEDSGKLVADQLVIAQKAIAELKDNRDVLEKMLDDQITIDEADKMCDRLEEKHMLEDGSYPSEKAITPT